MNIRIPLYWIIVALPLSWGVLQSVNTALPLFGAKPLVIPYLTIPVPVAAPAAKPAAVVVATPTPLPAVEAATPAPVATAAPTP